jgi:hypothetical protein
MDYDLISEDEYASLPDEDDRCFVEFEKICRRNMIRMLDQESSGDFNQAVRQQYMAAVSAVAQECNIPNIHYEPETGSRFWEQFDLFSLAVQGEVARIRIRLRGQRHPYSVSLTGSTRTIIEHYISRIRDLVSKSDMDVDRKRRIEDKLDELLSELTKQRMSFAKTLAILLTLTTSLAAVTTIAADGQSAIAHIMQLIGQDKETEDEAAKRLAPPPKALPAPQNNPASRRASVRHSATRDLDDEIPF